MTARPDLPPRGRTHLAPFEARVLEQLTTHAGPNGISTTALHGTFGDRKSINMRQLNNALQGLAALGLAQRHKRRGVGGLCWTLPGVVFADASHGMADRVLCVETDATARELEKLFAITPHRYDHGDIVTLERGRVGLKPSLPLPGRAIGGW